MSKVKDDIKAPKDAKATGTRKPGAKADSDWETDGDWKVNLKTGERKRAGRALPLEIRLREFWLGISGGAALAGDSFTSGAIKAKHEELAYGYAKLAQANSQVKFVLEKFLVGSAYTEAIVPTVSLLIMVGWHWGIIPSKIGVPMTFANGMLPVTREQEIQMKVQAETEQREAERAEAQRNANGAGGGSN